MAFLLFPSEWVFVWNVHTTTKKCIEHIHMIELFLYVRCIQSMFPDVGWMGIVEAATIFHRLLSSYITIHWGIWGEVLYHRPKLVIDNLSLQKQNPRTTWQHHFSIQNAGNCYTMKDNPSPVHFYATCIFYDMLSRKTALFSYFIWRNIALAFTHSGCNCFSTRGECACVSVRHFCTAAC